MLQGRQGRLERQGRVGVRTAREGWGETGKQRVQVETLYTCNNCYMYTHYPTLSSQGKALMYFVHDSTVIHKVAPNPG